MAIVTAKDIAARLGLSPSAVSLALNGKPGVSERTRSQVLDLAAQLGYTLPRSAGSGEGQKRTICFMIYVDTVVSIAEHTTFSSFVLKGVEAEATANGFQTVVRYLYAGKPLERQVANILAEASAIVILGTDITQRSVREIAAFVDSASTVPIVILDNFLLSDKVDCVGNDNRAGAMLIVRHFLSQGMRSIGYFRSRQRIEPYDMREQGIREALKEANLELHTVVDVDIASEGAFRDVDRWLKSEPVLPEAFFAENDVVAAAAMRALAMNGVKVPEQVAIVGFDDIPICTITVPPLTSVHAYKETIGRMAVSTVLQRLRSGQNTRTAQQVGLMKIEMSMQLRVRKSSVKG